MRVNVDFQIKFPGKNSVNYLSVARCMEKSVLIRIFEMIRIFIRKSANGTEIQR